MKQGLKRASVAFILVAALAGAAVLDPRIKAALDSISAQSLRGRLSFIASDALEGRGTPSHGLTIASEYIASEFRRAGLEPRGDTPGSFFQEAPIEFTEGSGERKITRRARVRNVIGILRGSDRVLRDECVMLSAHYDHLGRKGTGPGDRIYNGANDNGSGTVTVMEIADALSKLDPHPRRSILFIAFAAEEEGLLGSRYYARHPAWPLSRTIADLNLEQLGRTDASDGEQKRKATLTGFGFSTISNTLRKAGEETGIRVYDSEPSSTRFFVSSDNLALAEVGVPANTVAVAYMFPDYHKVGDEWRKIDYGNLAHVDRMLALAVVMLADDPRTPHWTNEAAAQKYREAWKRLHPGESSKVGN